MLEPVLDLKHFAPSASFPAAPCVLDDRLVDAYLAATGEAHPLYALGYAPPLCLVLVRFSKASLGGRWPNGTLQLDQRFRCLRALRRGERVMLDLRIGSRGERNGRPQVEMLTTARDEQGLIVAELGSTSAWPRGSGGTHDSGGGEPVATRPAPEPAATAAAPIGPVTDRFPMERLRAYGEVAGARDPIHLDPAFGKASPLGVNIAQGKLVMTLISRLMLDHLGQDWLESGYLDIRFRRPVPVGAEVHAWASPVAGAGDNAFSVWISDSAGERVIVGRAGFDARQ